MKFKVNQNSMKKILFIAGLVSTMLLAACSSEESVVKEDGKVNAAKGITFRLTEEAFVPGVTNNGKAGAKGTRAIETQTVNLGNGLVAEVSLEPDTADMAPAATGVTRATVSDGHYTIYAVDASNVRHDGIKGTMTSGVFTPDVAGQEWFLNGGETYTFVCINDAVTDNGTGLRYTYSMPAGINQNAMIGVTTHTVSNTEHDVVAFTMRHQNARIRYQVTSYTTPCVGAKFGIGGSVSGTGYGITDYDVKGTQTARSGGFLAISFGPITMTADHPMTYSSIVETYKTSTPYVYYPDAFPLMYAQYTMSSGTLYGESLQAKVFPTALMNSTTLQKNHSYVYNIKVKPSVLYLFQDGTVGTLADKGTRTPIGVVVKEKTATEEGTAVALKEATVSGNNDFTYSTPYGSSSMFATTNSTTYADINDGQNDVNGYKWTWEAASNPHDHVVKANKYQDYTPYYAAGHYVPDVAVTGANVGHWYLPALGDWALLFKALDRWTPTPNTTYPKSGTFPWDKTKVNAAFTAAGGKGLFAFGPYGYLIYWTSTEYTQTMMFPYLYGISGNTINIDANAKHNITGKVRPFVHF
ncbi:hypothetical protein HMPREF9944_02398 [Segatella maculosa OT 289]|uniref:Fibrobacter succinogenes major paralogous domain-containing protein n=2 Tax=Segatella maculosa TaxID=439703 RepID=H1HQF4_9BACT|nr:hypothetical protein HMPREF9944_02398 [Segatella maculosa OT 289]